MTATETHWDADASTFARELVGRKITAITNAAILLDDGTTLVMENTADCCAWFEVKGVSASEGIADNVVTAVTSRPFADGETDEAFSIVVLSEATELASIDIDGTESNGYYCHSINLEVTRPAGATK